MFCSWDAASDPPLELLEHAFRTKTTNTLVAISRRNNPSVMAMDMKSDFQHLEEWLSQAGRFPASVKKVAFDEGSTRHRTSDKPQHTVDILPAHEKGANNGGLPKILHVGVNIGNEGQSYNVYRRASEGILPRRGAYTSLSCRVAHVGENRSINIRTTVRRRATDPDCYNTIFANDASRELDEEGTPGDGHYEIPVHRETEFLVGARGSIPRIGDNCPLNVILYGHHKAKRMQ
ncbi:hypothetical protein ARMGADRAFT_1031504 [Armillaria gallica]|uniref:Uncharacterized protein n=1 Tax=Armillaria gallica TaxID=47427 RepID=A0A2H3DX61_ARMGA|nr:hypothetical protein ARMGADRAFT_1031504 [Armillaria gallica]